MRSALYLIEIPHQTTTFSGCRRVNASCILSKFHIKPQLLRSRNAKTRVVSYRNSTSNHNCRSFIVCSRVVVSYWNSTSNHNLLQVKMVRCAVVSYWNSTSNHNGEASFDKNIALYLIEILHQTTTRCSSMSMPAKLYLIEILHQTTTIGKKTLNVDELYLIEILHQTTTRAFVLARKQPLYLIEILHQTTTNTLTNPPKY